ncbi:serine/threonine-protein kinase TOR [Physcomitrium patens]|uniref:Serine/threonine-protein kinase TOR n=3 Tax=Embryophyta TaxID=3193 RepID=A0A2K1KED1_PHYPA|nr:serine/threonine-protein kinase TOR-like [Physcomitrium patens]PNR52136.1 hypothetical protein PHYPA_008510 [Physcomitrium patens]|eukprot:XP_024379368.1 serine/threonine-protein kinase TOR-like [Physcomitrella patens]
MAAGTVGMGPHRAPDSLRRLLEGSSQNLAKHVEEEARDLGGEAFTRFMDNLYDKIQTLAESDEVRDNLACVRAIRELIDLQLGEIATKIAKFASNLRHIFEHKTDSEVLVNASRALGHLAATGGALTADVVEYQVKKSLEWLQEPRVENHRFAAVLILKEMAENAPTVFNVHVSDFIEAVWVALRDPKMQVREAAVKALRACLCVIEKRETRWRVQWYYRMFERTQDGLGPSASVESIHGSLLAVGELLRNTGEFMMSRYKEVASFVLKYREIRNPLVRQSITALLPRIAHFLRDRFVSSYLKICMDHLLNVMRKADERESGFHALAEMASAVGKELKEYLPIIMSILKDAINPPRRGRPSLEAVACVGALADAIGPDMKPYVEGLLDSMFALGLTPTLVHALKQISSRIDSLLPVIQERLLDSISFVLAKTPYRTTRGVTPVVRPLKNAWMPSTMDISGPALTQLALNTLTNFDLRGHELLEFAREAVIVYLEDDDAATRREAAECCSHLVEHSSKIVELIAITPVVVNTRSGRTTGVGIRRRRLLIEEILEKLLVAAVADPDVGVRKTVFLSLHKYHSFDEYLAQADSLRAIFIALTDEAYEVRELTITMAGRLADHNPAYVLPALRRHLVQLLTDLRHSADSKSREESAKLLGCLIKACERLMGPYIDPVLRTLLEKLQEGSVGTGNNGVIAGVLATVGDLAKVGGCTLRRYMPDLMRPIVEALMDGTSFSKREVAVATLGKVVESTGYVVRPYTEFPHLLGLLLRLLNSDLSDSARREVLKVLGIIGALDPHQHKRNQQFLPGPHGEGARVNGAESGTHNAQSLEEVPVELLQSGGLLTTNEDYFPTVAIKALLRVLRDPTLSSYHHRVVGSLMYILKSMGLSCVPYLPKVLPELFFTIRNCEDVLREFSFWQLASLVSIVRQHIRKYLGEILKLVHEYWNLLMLPLSPRTGPSMLHTNAKAGNISPVLNLVEQLSLALNDEFRGYLPEFLRLCVTVLTDAERTGDYKKVPPVLHTFEVLGGSVDEHMYLILPALVRLFRPDVSNAPLEIRRAAIKTLGRLLPCVQVSGLVSSVLLPLTRVLDGSINELRKDAVDTICALAVAMGADFAYYVPSVRKPMLRHHVHHPQFDALETRLNRREPAYMDVHSTPPATVPPVVAYGSIPSSPSFHNLNWDGEVCDGENFDSSGNSRPLTVNEGALRIAWESSQRSTKEDWTEWMRHFSVELLKESPSRPLRTCAGLAQLQPFVARELFAAGFVSCWSQLNLQHQEQLVRSLVIAFSSPNIPPEILASLLNLAEFMEHDEKPLPIDIRTLGQLAEKCHAYAKALHYKEMEFEGAQSMDSDAIQALTVETQPQPVSAVEALIHINNQLNQHEAAMGILTYARKHLRVDLKESWYEKLQHWELALEAYKKKALQCQSNPDELQSATLGRMRCLAALARWEELSILCRDSWNPVEVSRCHEMAPMAASAAWNMGNWKEMEKYVTLLEDGTNTQVHLPTLNTSGSGNGASDGAFFKAVLCVRRSVDAKRQSDAVDPNSPRYRELIAGFNREINESMQEASQCVQKARNCLATELAALVLESYDRAYSNMVRVQQLSELEEVMEYLSLPSPKEPRADLIRKMWRDRMHGTKRKVEVWQSLLAVRTLVLPRTEDTETWLKFASLCRKSGRDRQARSTLVKLLQYDPETSPPDDLPFASAPQVMLAYYKYQWSLGDETQRRDAFLRLQEIAADLTEQNVAEVSGLFMPNASSDVSSTVGGVPLLARVHLKLGAWRWHLNPSLDDETVRGILKDLSSATQYASKWAKAWHKWALFNTALIVSYTSRGQHAAAGRHVVLAISAYFRSIANGAADNGRDGCLQDILRLLTLWFYHGASRDVQDALQKGFDLVPVETWLAVLPQIIARIHSNTPAVRTLIQQLLVRIGRSHPQALMYPLLVACKSISTLRQKSAQYVVDQVRHHSGTLVEQAQLVSKELIRVAILWHEMWHEALEEASRLYFGERNVDAMFNCLQPLHALLEREGPVTVKEQQFVQNYGRELAEANECCTKYKRTGKEAELTQAWDLYYHVFKRINKQLPSLTTLELQTVSPELLEARNLELAVPGTYRAAAPLVKIAGFSHQLVVITSKQRPRRLTIQGDNGKNYDFLLKGHEDLRQDERVMQLFGLVNTLLGNSRLTAEKDLSIQRYDVIPLSPNSGLIGWVPNCDTLHHLIREYRDARKVLVNAEHRTMLGFAPDYERLTLMAKVEVFEHALDNSLGNDLAKVLWLKSRSSEVWLDRRTNYTRSLAVMSMVGYLLGLGDRHPSNLMLDRHSGKILHIDFGDCFEASMNREKFPEKVPFRLTRMLVKAMEVSGIEGNFRSTCENVMQVLRTNKDSVMAMMEAFVHDPLINWRLFTLPEPPHITGQGRAGGHGNTEEGNRTSNIPSPPQRGARERELLQALGQLGDANEVLNERAVAVMARMSNKLTGHDFMPTSTASHLLEPRGDGRELEPGLSVKTQVQKLITQAMSHENLCQSYVGWCPFW